MVDPHSSSAPSLPAPDLPAGVPYRILRRLGGGTHGAVFEAEQVESRRRVAIKVLRAQYAGREDVADRLRLEAQAAAALAPRTSHVVQILDFGRTTSGLPYIVMERLEGRTLAAELSARGALPAAEAVDIAVQILDGLAVAHDAGIVHRDVKPDNVFLCPSPSPTSEGFPMVKLVDFGLAKVVGNGRSEGGLAPLAQATAEGTMMGTPLYFSPEQARGETATPLSDIYSTGVVLYTMLTGREPFAARGNVYVLVKAHLLEVPRPPSSVSPLPVAEALDRAVLMALEKRPEDRYDSARAFRMALERALRPVPKQWLATEPMEGATAVPPGATPTEPAKQTAATSPAPRRRAGRLLALGAKAFAASLVVGGVVSFAWRWSLRPARPQADEATAAPSSAPAPPPVRPPLAVTVEPVSPAAAPPANPPRLAASTVPASTAIGRSAKPNEMQTTPRSVPVLAPPAPHRAFGIHN
jgi:serine/threonine-protein kinase